ncbi:hypothetical protein LK09_13335 [Microbacterium mangrovi]|uniref:Mechanosensitive ion channel MscS domain-containing protein n=1 Tax=Microbacterium mangrovi TaxID=1348253 RepID=A0A0B2A6P8_9MICO|nr:mechanosensitive ion channel family protein [Microbacterium mangrovi]KHK97223.1 hypothetical protein LK09_13335 [Microbacterium mangrovi]
MDLSKILPQGTSWLQLLAAVIAIVVAWVISHYARRGVLALAARTPGISKTLGDTAARVTGLTILLLGIGVALAVMGANVQPLLAFVVVVGVVVVLVLRGVADNFAAGVIIQSRHPVSLGDEVQIEGVDGKVLVGTVLETESRAVIIRTYDGLTVHVPNSKFLSDVIVNDTTFGARRSAVRVGIERGDAPVATLLALARDAAASAPGVHGDPAVATVLEAVSPERVTTVVQFWHAPSAGVATTAAVIGAVAASLEDAGHPASIASATAPSTMQAPGGV